MIDALIKKKLLQQDPKDQGFVENPYILYAKLHEQGTPVFWKNYGFWCIYDFESVNRALRERRFARLPPAGHEAPSTPSHMQDFARVEKFSLLALEPPAHTPLSQVVNRAFVSRQINRLSVSMKEYAHHCIDQFESNGSVELLSGYATPIPLTFITRLLGVPESKGQQLVDWSHAMVKAYTLTQSHVEELAANQAAAEFADFMEQLIESKRHTPDDGLISNLIDAQIDDRALGNEEITSIAILLLNAGHEATVHQIGNAVSTLLSVYPIEKRNSLLELLANDATADAVAAECLRFAAPLHLFTRYAQEDIELDGGLCLRKGEQVGLLLAAANRCPRKFANPNQFQALRSDAAHLSLGAGIHFCAGAPLAKLELRIALQVLFERIPTLQLQAQPHYQDSYHFHGLNSLSLTW